MGQCKSRVVFLIGVISFMIESETENEWVAVAMAEDFQQKNVVLVAGIIGAVVLVLGFGGIVFLLQG